MPLTIDIDVGDEGITVPAIYQVCPRCSGHGTHDHPAFSNGIPDAEFAEDPDFREAYFSGAYDVTCEECGGLRVVLVPDRDRIDKETLASIDAHERALCEMAATYAAERRMGA